MSALTSHARATSAKDRRGRILCRFPPNHRPKRSSGPMGAATLAIRLPRLSAANPPPRISRGNPEDLGSGRYGTEPVSYTHLRAHETRHDLVCRLLLEK